MNKSYLRANVTTLMTALLFAPFHSNHAAPIGTHAITYTLHGNVEVDTQGQRHQHNALNQLTTAQTDDQQTITHYYYSNGLRAGTSDGTELYAHYYTRHNHRVNSTHHTAWSSHLIGQQAELRRSPTQADIMVRDRQGSVIQSVLPTNTQEHDYSAHGLDTLTTDTPTLSLEHTPWRYANYPYDNTTGLYYLKARDYNPHHRAFVQADSYAVNDYGLSNAYFYGNNPLNGTDPTGHDFDDTMNMAASITAGIMGIGMLGMLGLTLQKAYKINIAKNIYRETRQDFTLSRTALETPELIRHSRMKQYKRLSLSKFEPLDGQLEKNLLATKDVDTFLNSARQNHYGNCTTQCLAVGQKLDAAKIPYGLYDLLQPHHAFPIANFKQGTFLIDTWMGKFTKIAEPGVVANPRKGLPWQVKQKLYDEVFEQGPVSVAKRQGLTPQDYYDSKITTGGESYRNHWGHFKSAEPAQ